MDKTETNGFESHNITLMPGCQPQMNFGKESNCNIQVAQNVCSTNDQKAIWKGRCLRPRGNGHSQFSHIGIRVTHTLNKLR